MLATPLILSSVARSFSFLVLIQNTKLFFFKGDILLISGSSFYFGSLLEEVYMS